MIGVSGEAGKEDFATERMETREERTRVMISMKRQKAKKTPNNILTRF